MKDKLSALAKRWETALLGLIVLAIVWGSQLSPFFLNAENLLRQTRAFIVIGLLALGLTVVVIAGEIDLSGESILAVCAVSLGLLYEAGLSIGMAGVLVVFLGGLLGAINGILVGVMHLPSLVVTLASLIGFRGLAFVLLERRPISGFPDWFVAFGNDTIGLTLIPQSLLPFTFIALMIAGLLHLTIYGRRMYAIGNNRATAELSGVPVTWIRVQAFIISGILAGLAAMLLAARFGSVRADAAQGAVLDVVTVVLLGGVSIFGGFGTIGGVILSLILVGLLENGMSLANIAAEIQQLILGALLIVAVIIPRLATAIKEWSGSGQTEIMQSAPGRNVQ